MGELLEVVSTSQRSRRKMTKQEAVDALDGFRKEFRALGQMQAIQAFNTLMITGGAVTTAHNLARDFSSALAILKSVFDAMDHKRIQFPSN
jgi:hypothetical protein